MEIFTGLKTPPLLISPTPLRIYKDVRATDEAKMAEIINIAVLHEAVEKVHKEVEKKNTANRTRAQKWYNAKTNVLPLNIAIGDYEMIRTHAKREHKLQSKWRGLMLVKEARASLVFVVEDLINAKQFNVHAQRMLIHPINKTSPHVSEELKQQALHYHSPYHLVDETHNIRKHKNESHLLIRWSGLSED